MTELQKLSLKKLRKKRLPLFVMDRKSKKGGFVIVDAESYQKPASTSLAPVKKKRIDPQQIPDYRNMGILWDRPDLDNKGFHQRLKDETHYENPWAVKRLLEKVPSQVATRLLSLDEIKEGLAKVRLYPHFIQEAWEHAVRYWSENP